MSRPRLHDDALRTRLLEVTSEVVSTAGPGAVTVRDVARRAGTSASAVYALFGSKDALLAGVVEEGFHRFGKRLAAVPRTDSPRADLLELGMAYRRSALAEPHFYTAMFTRGGAPGTERSTFAVLRDAVRRVLDESPPRDAGGAPGPARSAPTGDRDDAPTRVAIGLWAQVHGLVSLELASLLPGEPAAHAARYESLLRAAGTAAWG